MKAMPEDLRVSLVPIIPTRGIQDHDREALVMGREDLVVVTKWDGRYVAALREALRHTTHSFAAHLGVGVRTITTWEVRGATVEPLPEMQAILDTALEKATPSERARFVFFCRGLTPIILLRSDGGRPASRARPRSPNANLGPKAREGADHGS